MKFRLSLIPSIWGAIATGPAVWAGASILAVGGVVALEGGSVAYVLAIVFTGLIGTSCGVLSCLGAYKDAQEQELLENRIVNLEAQIEDLKQMISENSSSPKISPNRSEENLLEYPRDQRRCSTSLIKDLLCCSWFNNNSGNENEEHNLDDVAVSYQQGI